MVERWERERKKKIDKNAGQQAYTYLRRAHIASIAANSAAFKFCADGGSNRLYDAFKDEPDKLERQVSRRRLCTLPF